MLFFLNVNVRYKGAHPLTKRIWNSLIKETLRVAGEYWQRKFLPKHFTEAGAKEYRYALRSGQTQPRGSKGFKRSYFGRKLLSPTRGGGPGQALPLVNSGVSQRLARVRDIRATSKRVRVILPGGFNRRHPASRVDMRKEITRVSRREQKDLAGVADRDIQMRLDRVREQSDKKLA